MPLNETDLQRVVLLMVSGQSGIDLANSCVKLGIAEDAIPDVISEAKLRIRKAANYDHNHELGVAYTRLNDLYTRTLKMGDFKTALSIQRDLTRLLSLSEKPLEIKSEEIELAARIKAHFDGGCYPNPGGKMTYGWHATLQVDGQPDLLLGRDGGVLTYHTNTNNVAEYLALIELLSWVEKLDPKGVNKIVIQGDSQIVCNGIRSRDPHPKKPHLHKLCREAQQLIANIRTAMDVQIVWRVREENSRADRLAMTEGPINETS